MIPLSKWSYLSIELKNKKIFLRLLKIESYCRLKKKLRRGIMYQISRILSCLFVVLVAVVIIIYLFFLFLWQSRIFYVVKG